jgi:hypothetical protein
MVKNPLHDVETTLACANCQQVGHEFKNCPFVDDKLKLLMIKRFKKILQPVILSTPTTHVGVPMQQIQPQLSLVINPTPINRHLN